MQSLLCTEAARAADELLVMQWRVGVEALVPTIQLFVEAPDVRKASCHPRSMRSHILWHE
jgi:hypothetical protein